MSPTTSHHTCLSWEESGATLLLRIFSYSTLIIISGRASDHDDMARFLFRLCYRVAQGSSCELSSRKTTVRYGDGWLSHPISETKVITCDRSFTYSSICHAFYFLYFLMMSLRISMCSNNGPRLPMLHAHHRLEVENDIWHEMTLFLGKRINATMLLHEQFPFDLLLPRYLGY